MKLNVTVTSEEEFLSWSKVDLDEDDVLVVYSDGLVNLVRDYYQKGQDELQPS
jgi:hypothetical protein